jgi:hypothetical protein
MEAKYAICDGKFAVLRKSSKCQTECHADFDVKLAVKRVAYFQTVCPDFIIVLYIKLNGTI